jgi:hypothetical protein
MHSRFFLRDADANHTKMASGRLAAVTSWLSDARVIGVQRLQDTPSGHIGARPIFAGPATFMRSKRVVEVAPLPKRNFLLE